ncbi:uncharacterized protein LOC134272071 [Saccostrea cucullata]
MVQSCVRKTGGSSGDFTCDGQSVDTSRHRCAASSERLVGADGMSIVRLQYQKRGISHQAASILLASWKSGTKKQYKTFYTRWFQYCSEKSIDPFCTTIETVIEFLAHLFRLGLGYSAINTARGALSSVGLIFDGFTVGCHPLVIRFMKGVFNLRPSKSRYVHTWDASIVIKYLRKLSPVKYLSLKDLTLKLVMLISLICASRVQTISCMKLSNMTRRRNSFVFTFSDLLKTCRPNSSMSDMVLKSYPPDRRLCVYIVLCEYLSRTARIRNKCDSLFISYVQPHKEVSRDTVARWIRTVMCSAGVDTTIFKAHSVRSASASKAKENFVPVDDILSKVGWSNVETFRKFYDKPVLNDDKYANAVLKLK